MLPHGDTIKYTGYLFLLITYTISSVYSRIIPSLGDSKLHTMSKSSSQYADFPEKNNNETQVFLDGTHLGNVLTWLLQSREQDEGPLSVDREEAALRDHTKPSVPIITLKWRKMFSRMFNYSKNSVRTVKRRKRNVETDISSPLSQLPSESTNLFNDSRLKGLDNNSNNTSDADRFQIAQLSQTRPHREIGSSSEHSSDPFLKSDSNSVEKNTWTNRNMTYYKEMIRKLALEREVKHSAQVAFLCLSGLFSLMTWVIWYNGICRNRSSKYMYWDRRETATTDLRDIFYRRGKYLPMFQDKEYDVVYVKDKGTDP